MKSKYIWTPLLMAISAIMGVYLGRIAGSNEVANEMSGSSIFPRPSSPGKLQTILNLISSEYVDSISTDTVVEEFIPKILEKLDPHSVYLPASEFEKATADLKSGFGGIGVMFTISDDTISVISVVAGGPSSHVGVLPGDKIVKVNGSAFVGDTISNDIVMNNLRGEVGTGVDITVKRGDEYIDFSIIRDVIPITSVDVSYVIEPGVGYMRIDRFAEKTYEEMLKGIAKLKSEKCNTLVVDLRSNSGGLLDVVIKMCNEFLASGDMIVYTEGAHQSREEVRANGLGTCQNMSVVVLVDEYSASASEIFAGAIQDNDRGVVIGRRTFGKGLVQTQIPLRDNSAIRLTVARYHTPSGRCIQRPYDDGVASYYDDFYRRYQSGELFDADSVKFDQTQRFTTKNGRTVFGGGGIMPDIFVARDTAIASNYLYKLRAKGIIYRFALEYADKHRSQLSQMSTAELIDYLCSIDLLPEINNFAVSRGVAKARSSVDEHKVINCEVRAYIGRNIKDSEAFYPIINADDPVVMKALEVIHEQ